MTRPAAIYQTIPVALIDVPEDRSRELDAAAAEALAGMITEVGLIKPISVRAAPNGRFLLVSGRRRLAAFELLKKFAIPARISAAADDEEAKLEEIIENIGHQALSALDRAHSLYDLKRIYERRYPETRKGGNRGNQHAGGRMRHNDILSFSQNAAEKVGLDKRSIERAVAIWKCLSVVSRQRCAGAWIAEHQASLIHLSQLGHAMQAKVLDILLAVRPKATTVPDALAIIEDGRRLTHVEKRFLTINRALSRLEDGELDTVVAMNEERIVASLKRQGSI